MTSLLRPTATDASRQSHDELANFLATFLPPSPRPRDVDYFYHVPRRFMPARPPPDLTARTEPIAGLSETAIPSTLPEPVPAVVPKNNTPVSHVTFSITPTPGVYTSLSAIAPSVPYSSRPAAFIHRPWSLDRRAAPPGTTVLASHTGFDEVLTTGWNVQLAARLGLEVGQVELEDGSSVEPVEDLKMIAGKCVCIQGYKGDPERRIGFVGAFGHTLRGTKRSGPLREEIGDEDVDGGVSLLGSGGNEPAESSDTSATHTKTVSSQDILAKIEREFDGIGEVFDFASPLYATQVKDQEMTSIEVQPPTDVTTPLTSITTLNNADAASDPAPALLSLSTDPQQPSITSETTTATPPRRPKRQKKNPPEPQPQIPPSIPLSSASTNPLIPTSTVSAVAILNAFHPEEVERAISAAHTDGWISWKGVSLGGATEAVHTVPGDRANDVNITAALDGEGHSVPQAELGAQADLLSQPRQPPQAQQTPQATTCPSLFSSNGRLLCLTGAPRAPGLLHVQRYYSQLITVVCVGHAACEEWGIRFLAGECRKKWPTLDVRTVFEPEVVVPRERKKARGEGEEGKGV